MLVDDQLNALKDVSTTVKLDFKDEVCRIRFIDGLFLNVDANRFGIRCTGKVVRLSDDKLIIQLLQANGNLKDLAGRNVELSFSYLNQFFYFNTKVISQDPDHYIIIGKPKEIFKTQRREYLRMPVSVSIKVKSVDYRDLDLELEGEFTAAGLRVKDISAGGLRIERGKPIDPEESAQFVSPEEVEKNSVVDMYITFPGIGKTITAAGRVAWINQIANKYQIGLRFSNIIKRDQDFIVRFLFDEQLKQSRGIKNLKKN